MNRFRHMAFALVATTLVAGPATAQFSDSYKFLKAVRDADGTKVTEALDVPGSQIVNTRDYATGEGVLHIVVKRRDDTWLRFLLSKGADPDMRDKEGNTPLGLAAQVGFSEAVQMLLERRARVDLENARGETPLIMAVHNRDIATARLLLEVGANPAKTDRVAGKSARDYAAEDRRAAPILKLIDDAKAKKPATKMSGPSL